MIFAGMFEARDVEEEGFVEAIFLGDGGARLLDGTRVEPVVLDTVVDDANVVAVDVEKLFDVARGVLADGDDFVLAAGEMFDDDASVEHAGEVVFARDAEWGEIVDGGDERAG